ncbi:MAG: hypothetical protein CMK42_01995 [Porticoccaceae bacterium]|nr:hypothetical protein [Porticoccaceae bacterium]
MFKVVKAPLGMSAGRLKLDMCFLSLWPPAETDNDKDKQIIAKSFFCIIYILCESEAKIYSFLHLTLWQGG